MPKQDPFAEFEDWLVDGPAGEWPEPWETEKELTPEQKEVVETNAARLLNWDGWKKRVDAFEAAIQALPDAEEQKKKRTDYHIRFDRFDFESGAKNFSNLNFPCSVSFAAVYFKDGDVSFREAQFGEGNVSFREAQFGEGSVSFREAQFGEGDVSFRKTQFGKGNVYFKEAQFGEGSVNFRDAQFGDGVTYLTDMKLSVATMSASDMVACHLYVKTHFPSKVDFQRLKVTESAKFSACKFEQVPDFRNAKFDRPPDVANMDVPDPKLSKKYFWQFARASDPDDVPRLRKLKSMALQASDHERDGYFFAKEMRAKRGVETEGFFSLLFNTLYDWFSGYGQSFVKPLAWLAASFTLFFIIYTHIVEHSFNIANMRAFPGEHSLRNFLPLIGGLFRYAPTPKDYLSPYEKLYAQLPATDVSLLVTLGIVQSIIGGVLLFFFLLALRNRFRLK